MTNPNGGPTGIGTEDELHPHPIGNGSTSTTNQGPSQGQNQQHPPFALDLDVDDIPPLDSLPIAIVGNENDNVNVIPGSSTSNNVNVNVPQNQSQTQSQVSDLTMVQQEEEEEAVVSIPSQMTFQLWNEVAIGIDRNQTVIWKNAVDSLDDGLRYLQSSTEARTFVEKYMKPVISILLEQHPQKIGMMERNCVEDSLRLALSIIETELKLKIQNTGHTDISTSASTTTTTTSPPTEEQQLETYIAILDVLAMIFNKKKVYYKSNKMSSWNSGLPEVRNNLVMKFKAKRGFYFLAQYLHTQASSMTYFPPLETMRQLLIAACDAVPSKKEYADKPQLRKMIESDLIHVCKAVMAHLTSATEDYLKKQSNDVLNDLRTSLQRVFDKLMDSRREETLEFYEFSRMFALKLITSQSLPLKLYGWDNIGEMIESAQFDYKPPPKYYVVKKAGTEFVNGVYNFAGDLTSDGYVVPNGDISYERVVPVPSATTSTTTTSTSTNKDGNNNNNSDLKAKEKKITLFRCTMRSQQKWWFLSEADEQLPGTDKDIDYYQHKSKKDEEAEPPSAGWTTCREASDPPPILEPKGVMVPPGQEYNTMEHQLAKWAITNQIVELVLGNSIHREIVARSIPLIRFLASMCTKDDPLDDSIQPNEVGPNAYCLQASHLTLAWNTCKSKLDAAVSSEVYQLLVSILPKLPTSLSIQLLTTVQQSLDDSNPKDYLFEVAEFCSTLAGGNADSGSDVGNNCIYFEDEVRDVVLKLLWAVLTHPEAHLLKWYNILKNFVTQELRIEPMGARQREAFLEYCKRSLLDNLSQSSHIDESIALRMVTLTQFVLEACPLEQSAQLVFENRGELANLLFKELISYLTRRSNGDSMALSIKRTASNLTNNVDFKHNAALIERLNIIRYVYGISGTVEMSTDQLDTLWKLCHMSEDHEAVMVFLASASSNDTIHGSTGPSLGDNATYIGPTNQVHQPLTASYSDEVRVYAFQSLFCSNDVDWENLGLKAYTSFQILFKSLKKSLRASVTSHGVALDALWRICLEAGNNDVATQAMKDLLHVYSTISATKRQNEAAAKNAWSQKSTEEFSTTESFAKRIYACLQQVKQGLLNGTKLSRRSAERCVRILNAAIGHAAGSGKATTHAVHFKPASCKGLINKVEDIVQFIPHGLRGQDCYRTISVLAKRTHNMSAGGERLPQIERFSLQVHPLESLSSVKYKVAKRCSHDASLVKPISFNNNRTNLNVEPENAIVGDLGVVDGVEVVFLLCGNTLPQNQNDQNGRVVDKKSGLNTSDIFGGNGQGPTDEFFDILLDVLESLPISNKNDSADNLDAQRLVWDLLQSVPSNKGVVDKVRHVAQSPFLDTTDSTNDQEKMMIEIQRKDNEWDQLLDVNHYQKAVYVLQVIDLFLQPAAELLQQVDLSKGLASNLIKDAKSFRQSFIDSGGFDAVLRFFTRTRSNASEITHTFRRENSSTFRIIKCCLFGRVEALSLDNEKPLPPPKVDAAGGVLLKTLSESTSFFANLAIAVVNDNGISGNSVLDALSILQSLLILYPGSTAVLSSIPFSLAEKLIIMLLLWESKHIVNVVTIGTGRRIRKTTEDLILSTSELSAIAFKWLVAALDTIDNDADSSAEFFLVLLRLVDFNKDERQMTLLCTSLCRKLAKMPRPDITVLTSTDQSTGVLCGCLKLLKSLIHNNGITNISDGVDILLKATQCTSWAQTESLQSLSSNDATMVNLMGVIFDGFLSDEISSSKPAICHDNESRRLGFDVLAECATACKQGKGFIVLSSKISSIIQATAPSLRHRWGQNITSEDKGVLNASSNTSHYSGLRNQGCTCYMNSVLQQLFMMPELRKNLSSATLPSNLRSSCTPLTVTGSDLVGKFVSMHWENGSSYEALVESFDETTSMHKIRYIIPKVSTVSTAPDNRRQNRQYDLSKLPEELQDEFKLSEGRPGKETGVFQVLRTESMECAEESKVQQSIEQSSGNTMKPSDLKETEDEIAYRCLLEEVQRTFVHLDQGSRGRVFDPRSLVEASACLKLEFDIWQQNDASEFAMKLLDKLEVPLKRWSPSHFKYLEHTFRLKQTKQKLCKECGLKTNREENLMNIDCQIRGKADIHEALSTMCEVEYMEGDNKVFCDNCKKNCDTILRTAISALPDMLILSLKRFDLDYNTFETVKLNSRCAFDQSLNMKKYTLEGVEAVEKASMSDGDDDNQAYIDPLSVLPDEDYEYKLAGVLVHHGVAQGGHYYSFIRDRSNSDGKQPDKWFRFDDDEVTPFDASQIEVECFGGKVKKETKWPNGQVNTVETEQLANALMLFYEKVKPTKSYATDNDNDTEMGETAESQADLVMTTGVDVFEDDVKRSNTVHRSHAFLFDSEFQRFLRNLLGIAFHTDQMIDTIGESVVPDTPILLDAWHVPILELCTSFFFDVLLHSVDQSVLINWTKSLSGSLLSSPVGSQWVVHELARRTATINSNWIRIFASDCPEQASREAAMQIISYSIRGALKESKEMEALKKWTQSWTQPDLHQLCVNLPVSQVDDLNKIDAFEASSLGILIAHICLLLELAPRTWQYHSDLCVLLKEIGSIPTAEGGDILRHALATAQVPARLISLLLREKSPAQLQAVMPGASLSHEISEAIMRPYTTPTAHVFPLVNSVGTNTGANTGTSSLTSPSDHTNTLEAIAVIVGIRGAKNAQLVIETGQVKGIPMFDLTEKAKEALTIVFNECTSQQGIMDQKDVMNFMNVYGIDTVPVSPQRVTNMLTKYGKDSRHLTVDGFLMYYRDISQSNTIQIRSDLHTFGFRPDLSRRGKDTRIYAVGEREIPYNAIESVAIDTFSMMEAQPFSIGPYAEAGLASIHLYHVVYFTDSHLTECLLAWVALHQDTSRLLVETLKALYTAQGWGNESLQICTTILMILASLPNDRQTERITAIMQSSEKLYVRSSVGCGLLVVAKELSLAQSSQQYGADYHNNRAIMDRYIEAIKDLQKVRPIAKWMSDNKPLWEWIDQWLRSDSSHSYPNRGNRPTHQTLFDHQTHSDSDINDGLNDSEDDDDDFDVTADGYGGGTVIVKGAGIPEVNGSYSSNNKKFDDVARFTKTTFWQGREQEFTLFRCVLSNGTRRWYISIIPIGQKPGTNKDMDFYVCVATGHANEVPQSHNWETAKEYGANPPPIIEWKSDTSSMQSDDNDDVLIDQRVTSNDEYDGINDDNTNYDDALMEDAVQQ